MITLIKLVDGTELVGELLSNGDRITISNPLQINYFVRSPSSPPMITMHRYMPFAGNTCFMFFRDHVISQAEPNDGITQYYSATLKDIAQYMDPELNTSLLEKAVALSEDDPSELAQALMERMVKNPLLN